MDDTRPFPVQVDCMKLPGVHPGSSAIPWWLAEVAYEHYKSKYGNEQTLERMAERGGFGRKEVVSLIRQE